MTISTRNLLMNDNSAQAQRIESIKAGTLAALCLSFAFILTTFVNSLFLARYFGALSSLGGELFNWHTIASGSIAAMCGLQFGLTYRYVIRSDANFQLKLGAVLAFGLVRGLTQLDMGLNTPSFVLPLVVMAGESIAWFALATIALELAIGQGWVKTFKKFN